MMIAGQSARAEEIYNAELSDNTERWFNSDELLNAELSDTANKKSYGFNISDWASKPKFGAYIIGSYKYTDREGENGGPGFNARLIRAYVDGSILGDFNYRLQVELNGTPHVKDFYLEWKKYETFSVKIGQFKRCFTFENPMNPWDVGVGDYSQAVKKLAGMGDRCGEASTGGRDQGIQVQGDLLPISSDKHRLLHYQLAVYNGNGINKADNNSKKDLMGTIQVQPIKGLYVGLFGWHGDWTDGVTTYKRDRWSVGAKYDKNNWTVRSEYVNAEDNADAFYATVGIPVVDWLKIYLKYDEYRDNGTESTRKTIYTIAPNFRLHKNLNFQLQYNYCDDKTSSVGNYSEVWLETYVRF